MEGIISIILIFVLFFIAYKVIRKIIDSDYRRSIITGELKNETSKMSIKIRDWFVWNVQVNNEKGTAGGNIKINFPIKSALGVALLCIIIAVIAKASQASLIVTLIFLSFAVYHFRNWYKTLKIISANKAFENIQRLTRISENKYIGGVCAGIHRHYQISLLIIRASFVGLAFIGFIGVYIYLLLWIIIPKELATPQNN